MVRLDASGLWGRHKDVRVEVHACLVDEGYWLQERSGSTDDGSNAVGLKVLSFILLMGWLTLGFYEEHVMAMDDLW